LLSLSLLLCFSSFFSNLPFLSLSLFFLSPFSPVFRGEKRRSTPLPSQ
jgi:hypothetical protein